MKQIFGLIIALTLLSFMNIHPVAAQEAAPPAQKDSVMAQDVGNTICPVSGEKIYDKTKATYEYEGKIYNFCCPMCIESFKQDPQKYIKKIDEQAKAQPGVSHHDMKMAPAEASGESKE